MHSIVHIFNNSCLLGVYKLAEIMKLYIFNIPIYTHTILVLVLGLHANKFWFASIEYEEIKQMLKC